MRRALAVVVALVALSSAFYVGTHKLSNPDGYQSLRSNGGPGCPNNVPHASRYNIGLQYGSTCTPPTRAAWQIPLAVLLAAVGVGAMFAGADLRPRRRSVPGLSV